MQVQAQIQGQFKVQAGPTQTQMYYDAVHRRAEVDLQFLEFVKDGLTREELQTNINRRPALWSRYRNWLEKLPSSAKASQ